MLEQEYVSENFDPQYYCHYLFSLEFMNKLYIFCSDKCSFYFYMSWITTNLYAHKNMNTIIYLSIYYTRIYKINLKFILICSFYQFYVGIIFILFVFSDNFIFLFFYLGIFFNMIILNFLTLSVVWTCRRRHYKVLGI